LGVKIGTGIMTGIDDTLAPAATQHIVHALAWRPEV
jgi:hypothetical protein